MSSIKVSATINSSIDNVFYVFTDLDKAVDNLSGITKVEVLEGPAQMEVGTKWKETRLMFGKEATEEMWVSKLDKNKMYVVEADMAGMKCITTFTFEAKDANTTEVEMIFETIPYTFSAKLMSFVGILFKGATQKAFQQDLDDLKKVCEAKN